MRRKLTSVVIENLSAAEGRRVEVRDTLLPAFGVRVSGSKKTYFCAGRVHGKQRRVTLGRHPVLSLADARSAARKVLSELQLGTYEPEPSAESETFGAVVEEFLEKHVRANNRCVTEPTALLRQKFKSLHSMPIADVKRKHIVRCLDAMSTTPARSNRALAAVKKLFSWSLDRGIIEVHPVAGLKPPAKEKSRDRVLSDAELRTFFASLDGPPFGPLFALLLLTGQRRGEVSAMRRSQIDKAASVWTIPADIAKNDRTHVVPLSPSVVGLLARLSEDSDLIFSTTGKTPVSGFSKAKARLDERMGIDQWRAHDLRRTAASGMARLGVAPHVIEAVLNHRSGQISGIAKVYNRHQYLDEKRAALDLWAAHLESLR